MTAKLFLRENRQNPEQSVPSFIRLDKILVMLMLMYAYAVQLILYDVMCVDNCCFHASSSLVLVNRLSWSSQWQTFVSQSKWKCGERPWIWEKLPPHPHIWKQSIGMHSLWNSSRDIILSTMEKQDEQISPCLANLQRCQVTTFQGTHKNFGFF